jgi:hypothetical protein
MRFLFSVSFLVASVLFSQAATVTLVPTNAVWKYLDDGSNQGMAWRASAFDDTSWSNGIPQFGYGDRDETTVTRSNRTDGTRIITTYFRHRFTVANISELSNLHIGLVRDDGGVVYINGFEAFRQNMPNTAINFDTLAFGLNESVENNFFTNNTVTTNMLVEGENVLAVEIHQNQPGSSDVSFNLVFAAESSGGDTPPTVSITSPANGAIFPAPANITVSANASDAEGPVAQVEFFQNGISIAIDDTSPFSVDWNGVAAGSYALRAVARDGGGLFATSAVANITVGPVTLISTGAVWRYLDNGTDQGAAWRAVAFNDSTWSNGVAQLGYGDTPRDETTLVGFGPDANNKYITTYFRRAFTVNDPAAVQDLRVRLLRDDGAVVYLNGTEVIRENMPGGAIGFRTLAVNGITGADESTFYPFSISPTLLIAGNNVLAVEIHQNTNNSSDISFELELMANGIVGPGGPSVAITSPVNDETFASPANIAISGGVTPVSPAISTVEIFQNGIKLGNATLIPFSTVTRFDYTWNNAPAGSYALQAIATTGTGTKGTSAPVNITVSSTANQPPTVSITSPANNSTFKAPTNLNVQVSAADPDSSLSRVEFYRSGFFLGQSTVAPYNFNWSNALVGTFQLTAVAVDNNSARGTSAPVSITFTSAAPAVLVAMDSTWKYLATNEANAPTTDWTQRTYNDSLWGQGAAELGYGDGDEDTPIPCGIAVCGGNNPGKWITYYFRRKFNVTDPTAYTGLTVTLIYDDGAVVYLNGQEMYRVNMPTGTVSWSTTTPRSVPEPTPPDVRLISAAGLAAGENIITVEIHQQNDTSSDVSFNLELIGETGAIENDPPTVTLTSPSNNSSYTEPANVSIVAAASDPDGQVNRVEFFANGGKIGEDTTAPFNFVWGGIGVGIYDLMAIATDNFGSFGTSAVVRVSVIPSTAPTLTNRTPAPGTLNSLTQITVQFSESVDGVNASDLLINGFAATGLAGSNTLYTFNFPQPLEGPIRVEFAPGHGIVDRESPPKAFNATAPEATWQYNLLDNVAPTIVLTQPAAGATVQALEEVEITFSEAIANVHPADLLINGVPATDLNGSGAGPYRFGFAQPAPGTVQITWTNNHGIRDFSAAQNPFAAGSWSYTLNTNLPTTNIVINEIMFNPVPASAATEYIELYNRGGSAVNLTGWRFSRGVDFMFPVATLAPNAYLVVAANVTAFNAKYPGVANVIGGWQNILSNEREEIELEDANGNNVDSVEYADEGDWALRVRSSTGGTGWNWLSEADGLGKSLELCNPALSGNNGQNWLPSAPANGSPGIRNSHNTNNVPPLISDVTHSPAVPRSSDSIFVTAEIRDEQLSGVTVALRYRDHTTTSPADFGSTPMLDDGSHGDGAPGDGIYGAVLAAQPHGTIIEYYVEATDAGGRLRTWPAAARQSDSSLAQTCNALLQVSDEVYAGTQQLIRLIMTATEHEFMITLGRNRDREFNMTLIVIDGGDAAVRHNLGMRFRGAGSFGQNPPTFRINIPKDRPFRDASEYNLNSQYGFSQVTGAALAEKSGLAAAHVRAVQLRVNVFNWGLPDNNHPFLNFNVNETYGSYAFQEVMNDDWAARVFPDDDNGNVYRCGRPDTGLDYLGTNPNNYVNAGYSKESNTSENDWTDLILLTSILNNSPDSTYGRDVRSIVNIDQWMIYFAACQLMEYTETSLCNGANGQGVGDDFSMYRGVNDPRFIVMPHDFDTILGRGDTPGNPNENIFNMIAINTAGRFITHPEITPSYYRALKGLADTVFHPSQMDPLLDRLLGEYVPTTTIDAMKAFNVQRRNYVLSQIPLNLTINVSLPLVSGYFQTTSPTVNLDGQANVIETYSVKVNGAFASWSPWQRIWSISGVALSPGLNTVTVQTFDQSGTELQRSAVVIWYDDGNVQTVSGSLAANTTWAASAGPFVVSGNLIVPAGVTLTIDPGTTIYFAQGASITVNGRLIAEGTEARRIRFTRQPGTANSWGGIRFSNSNFDNRIVYSDIDYASTADPITAANSQILVDNVVFTGITRRIIDLNNSSALIRNSVFPTIAQDETIHGNIMPANGYVIIEGNYFGGTTGYSDIIDFTGGQRPGPILQVLNNTFNGGSDDALDLDQTDAHIEGNLFMNIHQDAIRDSTGNAIATDSNSDVTIVRNVFMNCDHMLLLKNGASAIVQNNTVVGIHTNATSTALAGVINFFEDRPGVTYGAGAVLEGNIFWDVDSNRHFVNVGPAVIITVNYSLLAGTNHPGVGNISDDPQFVSASDPQLRLGSPAIGSGPLGVDIGAYVPEGVAITGEPASPTGLTSATLNLYGPGITHYWYSLNGGAYGPQTPITTPISLSGLPNGPNFVSVIGKNSAGVSNAPVRSRVWLVRAGFPVVVINEVLARGDRIELHNPGSSAVSLAGWGISDEADTPFKFRFSIGASIGAGQYLVLTDAQVGFALKAEGDEVYLTNPNGMLVDSIIFGLQIDNYSIGRLANRQWALTVPTLGAQNRAARTGNPDTLKINEWLADGVTPYADDFIELFNPDPLPVALGGLFLTDTIAGTLDRHQITQLSFVAGGGFALFIADGDEDAGADHLDFQLAAEGGSIGLYHSDLSLIDCVTYGPQQTDISMGRRPNGADTLAFFDTPTPGAPNPVLILPGTTIVINEVLADNVTRAETDGTTPDWVELYNPTPNSINLVDMSISDDLEDPRRYVFPSFVIPSGGYFVIRFEPDEPVSSTNVGFGLKASGGAVFLYDNLANGGSMIDAIGYGVQARDFSVGRVPNGSDTWVLTLPTRRASNIAQPLGNPASLRVNEWMADPASGPDWFEIYNSDALPVALGGLQLRDEEDLFFIADLSYVGVGLFGFQRFEAVGNGADSPDEVYFALGRNADSITIGTPEGNAIDSIAWDETQEIGVSEGRLPDGTAAIVKFRTTPTPEASNYLPLSNVVINEVLAHSDAPYEDAIELRNLTGSSVNISGWYLSDSPNDLRKFRIPNGNSVSGFSFKVFYETNFNDAGLSARFSLDSARGDELYLSEASGTALTGYRSVVKFGATETAVSVGRYQTSVGVDFTILNALTFGNDDPPNVQQFRLGTGRSNAPPKVGPIVITEIMYHPPDDPGGIDNTLYEFIELRNISSNAVPLYHTGFPTNAWQFRDGVNYTFPADLTIAAGATILLVTFDPEDDPGALDAFRAHYSLGTGLAIFGPYNGRLDNGGEELALYKPDAPEPPSDVDAGFVPYIVVDRFVYDDVLPWPNAADGTGSSLHRINISQYANDPMNWTAAAPTPSPSPMPGNSDRDGDGMPNDWEIAYGFDPDDDSDASEDADDDGFTNLQEYLAGTDPLNALVIQISRNGSVVLQFNATANTSYTIEHRPSLASGTWEPLMNIPAGPAGPVQRTISTGNAAGFYRLRAPALP